MVFTKNPAKLEARAQGYEMRGKQAKALKCRQKIAKLTGTSPLGLQTGYGTGSPLMAQPFLGQQTLVGQPMMGQTFVGQQPLMGQQQTLLGQQTFGQQTFGQQTFVQQPLMGQQTLVGQPQVFNANGPMMNAPFAWQTTNTPARYEANALKWERRGNYNKAQKNRGKVWRLQNPQYATVQTPPTFYQNNQFVGYNVPVQTAPLQQRELTQVETIVRPTIVEETMRAERIVEVQPIIHREISQPQVKVIEQHTYETVPSQGPSTLTNAPIIQETVRPKIIEEIQPVVHREVPAPFVERVEQHVTEHIVNPTITTKEVLNGGIQQPAPFVAAGGAPFQTTTTQTTTTTQKAGLMGKVQNALHHNQNQTTTL